MYDDGFDGEGNVFPCDFMTFVIQLKVEKSEKSESSDVRSQTTSCKETFTASSSSPQQIHFFQ